MSLCTRRTQSLMQSTGHLKKQQSALMQYLHEKAGLSLGVQKMGGETSLKEKRIIDQVEATWQKWEKTEKLVRSSVEGAGGSVLPGGTVSLAKPSF